MCVAISRGKKMNFNFGANLAGFCIHVTYVEVFVYVTMFMCVYLLHRLPSPKQTNTLGKHFNFVC